MLLARALGPTPPCSTARAGLQLHGHQRGPIHGHGCSSPAPPAALRLKAAVLQRGRGPAQAGSSSAIPDRYGCSQPTFSRNCYIPRFDSYVGSVAVMHALTCALMTSKATKKERGRISRIRARLCTRLGEAHMTRTAHVGQSQRRDREVGRQKATPV